MPFLNKEETKKIFKELEKEFEIVMLNAYDEELAKEECEDYLENHNKNIDSLRPLSLYYIIQKLPAEEQIPFIKNNIEYIKQHDEKVFLYDKMSPKPLVSFFSLNQIKEISQIDSGIFKKIIDNNLEYITDRFSHKDYIDFYNDYYLFLNDIKNLKFINSLDRYQLIIINEVMNSGYNHELMETYQEKNKEFFLFVLKKYQSKIKSFTADELLNFVSYIEEISIYEKVIIENKQKLSDFFIKNNTGYLTYILKENSYYHQKVLLNYFYKELIENHNIKELIPCFCENTIVDLYNNDKQIFNNVTLKDLVILFSNKKFYSDKIKNILNNYEIIDIESLLDKNLFCDEWGFTNLEIVKFIENKFRNNIQVIGNIQDIDLNTSIFSEKYLKNLKELKEQLKNQTITKNDENYKKHLTNFLLYLKNINVIGTIEDNSLIEIERLFHRIVMGVPISTLFEITNIKEITIINRLRQKEFNVNEFTVLQLQKYNVKKHKELCKKFGNSCGYNGEYKKLILKLILIVGYEHAETILKINNDITILEHLVGNVDTINITLDQHGNPNLNQEIINLLFNDKQHTRIKNMLSNNENDLYKYFPRIFNEWESIKTENKHKNLSDIINLLKAHDILLPQKYYRLDKQFKYIGCSTNIITETLNLHNQIIKRVDSTIPRVSKTVDNYKFEVLRLHDMNGLSLGNITNCCFTVLGNAYSSLKHATTSKNGRILVITKDDKLIAHSWIWRNGDLLCIDNIEVFNQLNAIDFLNVYLEFSDAIIKESYLMEGTETCIKNVTIGHTCFDKKIIGIEKFPYLISSDCILKTKSFNGKFDNKRKVLSNLPHPIEEGVYTDSKNMQYLIRGNGNFNLFQSSYLYQDERMDIVNYIEGNSYDIDYLEELMNRINGLRYIKYEEENNLESYSELDFEEIEEAYCNEDWYTIKFKNNSIEKYICTSDERAYSEITLPNKTLVKK